MNVFKITLDTRAAQRILFFEHVQIIRLTEGTMHEDITIVVTYLFMSNSASRWTIWVARTLHKRGAIFLVDAFHGNAELAASVNHLLVVAFT